MIIQLNPPLPLDTPKGRGWAHLLIDYSQEHDLLWVVFLNENGECWTLPNSDVRMVNNFSLGRYGINPRDWYSFGAGDISRESRDVLGDRNYGETSRENTTRENPGTTTWISGNGPERE
jgi:hypothetical protein